ncbi:helix-turn-helix domain-containing protein [Streptomyces sp. NPDC004267]|uniref:helix-turn-helix domain-containing protein n=1 Tax=Streptomyces sp. NPDC004267 TaxID=3364694 RepID=UPI0036B0915F
MTQTSSPTRGRPTRLNTQTINRIAWAVQQGKSRQEIAAQVHVSPSTLQSWIRVGRQIRDHGGGATSGLGLLALRLVLEMENAERKRAAIAKTVPDAQLGANVPTRKRPVGRPALLNETLLEAVAPLCEAGQLWDAAKAAGVHKRSVLRWLARGREVHERGRATTEYERLCGILHARVHAARPGAAPVVLAQGEKDIPLPGPAPEPADVRPLAVGGVLPSGSAVDAVGKGSGPVEPVIVIGGARRGMLRRLLAAGFSLRPSRLVPYRS